VSTERVIRTFLDLIATAQVQLLILHTVSQYVTASWLLHLKNYRKSIAQILQVFTRCVTGYVRTKRSYCVFWTQTLYCEYKNKCIL